MSSSPSSFKKPHLRESVMLGSQGGCSPHNEGQILGMELGLMEMTEVEYSHVQHYAQPQLDAVAEPQDEQDVTSHPTVMDNSQSTVLSNVLTIVQQSAEPQEAVLYQGKKWIKTEEYVETPIASKSHYNKTLFLESLQHANVNPDSARQSQTNVRKRNRPCMPISQRREWHNARERERRRKIRLCYDTLNTMVPFCDSNTDTLTTLQSTMAFMRYINQTYGDSLKEEYVGFVHNTEL